MRRALLAVAILLHGISPAWSKDVMMRLRTQAGGEQIESTLYLAGNTMINDHGSSWIIVDMDKRTSTRIDRASRTYTVGSLGSTADRPPGAATGTPVSLKETGKSEKVAGYKAKEYTFSGPVNGSVWVTRDIDLPPVARSYQDMLDQTGPPGVASAVSKMNGVALRTITRMGKEDKFKSTIEVVEVKEASPPKDLLVVPEGFDLDARAR